VPFPPSSCCPLTIGVSDGTDYLLLHKDIRDLLSRRAKWLNKRNETRLDGLQPFPQDLQSGKYLTSFDVYGKLSRERRTSSYRW
jgi:hypothetical protein